MNQIRGIKVKDSAADAAASDASDQTNDSCNNSSSPRNSEVTPPAETARPKSTDKPEPKKPTGSVVKHNTLTGSTTVISSVDQHGRRKPATNGDSGEDGKEKNSPATSPVEKQSTELLRTCARCDKQESTLHEFKKCKK